MAMFSGSTPNDSGEMRLPVVMMTKFSTARKGVDAGFEESHVIVVQRTERNVNQPPPLNALK